jgi:cysteine-rich repeat protein
MNIRWVRGLGLGVGLVAACGGGEAGTAGESSSGGMVTTVPVTSVTTTGEPGTTGDATTGDLPTSGGTQGATGSSDDGTATEIDLTTGTADPVCGDGVLDPGEGCDDGEANADDAACTAQCQVAECGDGLLRAGVEACDDGAANADDAACTATCTVATCGDALVQAGVEQCDDGNADDADACVAGCKLAVCGDGFVGPGELCDDGNDVDDDACTTGCASPNCGDGKLQAAQGEECDDGNASDEDACLGTCVAAECGDAAVQAGVEECDDGNLDETDTCTAQCKAPSCSDGQVNGAETDVDCGGSCMKCGLGGACAANADCGQGLCIEQKCAIAKSCKQIKEAAPDSKDGNYTIDPDGPGPVAALPVRCDMDAGTCGYTWVRFDDPALLGDQNVYAAKCAAAGMEVVVTRTKPHAQALYDWNLSQNANLVNVFPNNNGAQGINNWHGTCQGQNCSFWMTDNANGDVGCTNYEPNGDNNTLHRIYLRQAGCGLQGNWNDANNTVAIQGWVICSTNDC